MQFLEGLHDEVSGTTALFAVLSATESYSIVPALAAKPGELAGITFRVLTQPSLEREIFLVTRRFLTLSPTAQGLRKAILASTEARNLPAGVALLGGAKVPAKGRSQPL
jgi:hypothetical protein